MDTTTASTTIRDRFNVSMLFLVLFLFLFLFFFVFRFEAFFLSLQKNFSAPKKLNTKIKNQVAIIKHPKAANKVPKTLTLGALKFNAHEVNTDKNRIHMETQDPGFNE